jgi:hypothetical protein
MRALENRIARLEATRAGPDNEFLVIHIRDFCSPIPPRARIGGPSGAVLNQRADETFEIFEARAVAAAKAAGYCFVAIDVPESMAA